MLLFRTTKLIDVLCYLGHWSCSLPYHIYSGSTSRSLLQSGSKHCVASRLLLNTAGLTLFLQKLCLRQNQISHVEFPMNLGATLQELDLYDNLISHVKGLDGLVHLTSLDLSFNKIKQIKNLHHLRELKDVYFVQNKIQKIEGLEGMTKLRNLELAANRIRVRSPGSRFRLHIHGSVGNWKPRHIERSWRTMAGEE